MLEALRRHDELQQARVLVPDDSCLEPTEVRPTSPRDEQDAGLVRALWAKASTGSSPAACEDALPVDSYRLRRLLAHWVEEGALRPRRAVAQDS